MGTMETDPLQTVAVETELYVAQDGWDQPARLFALVPTRELAASAPGLDTSGAGPDDLSAVEQDGFEVGDDIQKALARIAWPAAVRGVALSIERIVLPPGVDAGLPSDDAEALALLQVHKQRQDIRLVAAAHRDGRSVCVLRQRAHDSDDMVATGDNLAPGLLAALEATLLDDRPPGASSSR